MMILSILITSVIALGLYLYFLAKEKYKYFSSRGLPYIEPTFPLGNFWSTLLGKESMNECMARIYRKVDDKKFVGLFHGMKPVIMLRDPDLISAVLNKEFTHFHDRGIVINEEANPLEATLVSLNGRRWKMVRSKLSPTFTSGKIKGMIPLMDQSVDIFIKYLEKDLDREINFKNEFAKLASHIIGSCTFGIETDSMESEDSDFIRLGTKIMQPDFKGFVLIVLRFFFPALDRKLKFRTIPKEVNDFFFGLVKDTMDYRKKTGYFRNDFLQLLLELREKGEVQLAPDDVSNDSTSSDADINEKFVFTDNILTAQAGSFLVAGFETTSASLAFLCYELSKNPKIQDEIRNEVRIVKAKHGNFHYDALKEMHLLEAAINETLRMWSPGGAVFRLCNSTITLADNLTIEKGVLVVIPSAAIQRDPLYYPDPDVFKPERFLEGSPPNHTFLPFGSGPRNCIGERFVRLELKITIAKMLEKFQINTCPKMKAAEPIKFNKSSFINTPADGIYCVLNKI